MNQVLALQVVQCLARHGITEFCICPGARNSPLIDLLIQIPSVKRFHFFEERSAAFFALGRMKQTDRPVAILTTSGTAAGELLPATMEAYYSALPLVLLTADRPRRFRGSGAPQTAEQVGIFGTYAEQSVDLAEGEKLSLDSWSRMKPIHVNVCFEEPLIDASAKAALEDYIASSRNQHEEEHVEDMRTSHIPAADLELFFEKTRRPLVLVGALHREDRAAVKDFLLNYGAPTYFEAHSGLRENPELASLRIHGCDGILKRTGRAGYEIDGVLRIGGVPTLRLWRDLESLGGKIPVYSVSREPFSGLSWAKVFCASPARVFRDQRPRLKEALDEIQAFLSEDLALWEKTRRLFSEEPTSEQGLFHALSRVIPAGSRIFIGNSMPIREWDLAATFAPRGFEIGASRGLNGIDGQVSSFYGFSAPDQENWGILGDLTALYDLSGPWALTQLSRFSPELRATLVVVNNKGGKIFSRMFGPAEFQNPHDMDFSSWAKLWKLSYEAWQAIPDSGVETRANRIIELLPDEAATQRFWKAHDALWKS